jgi:hypothetical protein
MMVLVGCEESGVVRRAFKGRGHFAMSNDLVSARDCDDFHFVADVFDAIATTQWDLIILHPPCTYIAVSGNAWHAGTLRRREAIEWTVKLWEAATAACDKVCLENPVGLKLPGVNPQWIQPWQFGHPESKKTGLWLHGLQPLQETDNVKAVYDALPDKLRMRKHYMSPGPNRARDRSTTYLGIADAMAEQWS